MFNLSRISSKECLMVLIVSIIILIIYHAKIKEYIFCTTAKEHMINIDYVPTSWNRNECKFIMSETLENELNTNLITKDPENWNIYFPCGYDEIEKEINDMPIKDGAKYFILENPDLMVAKEYLWKNVVTHYGREKAKTLLPNSYVLYEKSDQDRLIKDFKPTNLYIMKKNIQRQEGLKITNSPDDIRDGFKNGYVLIQELLQNPYLISGRKTNMRFYVLVVCKGTETDVYVHNNGFMYYTKVPFRKNSLEDDVNITTGYIDRQVYIDNPLSHDDLRKYLDNPQRTNLLEIETEIRKQGLKISEVYFNRIFNVIKDVFIAFVGKISKKSDGTTKFNDTNITFQLFGVDVGVSDELNPMIMEINKGPDLGAKDERDSNIKHGVIRDMLRVIKVVNNGNSNNFIQIIDIDDGKFNLL